MSHGNGTRRAAHIDLATVVPASAAAVYAFLADIQDAEPIPQRATVHLAKEPPGETSVGTKWHEAVRFAPALWMHVDSIVTEASPPHILAMSFHSRWWSGVLRYEITDTDHGCVLWHREVLRPCRLLQPLTPWIERRLQQKIEERLDDIAAAVCDGTPAAV